MQEHQEYNYDLGYKYMLANCKTEKKVVLSHYILHRAFLLNDWKIQTKPSFPKPNQVFLLP